MTKLEMVKEMITKGYHTQYTAEEFAEMFTEEQIKRFKENFEKWLGNQKDWKVLLFLSIKIVKSLTNSAV